MFILCIADGFKQLKHHGTELQEKKRRLQEPKDPDHDHYWNVLMQNERIIFADFAANGNYLFCQKCIIKALNVSPQRLSRHVKSSKTISKASSWYDKEVAKEEVHLFPPPVH